VQVVADFGTGPLDTIDDRNRFLVANLDATLTIGEVNMQVSVRNISGGGFCITCDIPLQAADKCTVALRDGLPETRTYYAEVRWVKPTRNDMFIMGFEVVDSPTE